MAFKTWSNLISRQGIVSVCQFIGLGALATVAAPLIGQDWAVGHRLSMPTDWSFSHIVYTGNYTQNQIAHMQNDPRIYYSWLFQGHKPGTAKSNPNAGKPKKLAKPHRDWSLSLGNTASVAPNMSPAKFDFDV